MADAISNWLFRIRNEALQAYNDYAPQEYAESPTQRNYVNRSVLLEAKAEERISVTQVVPERGLGSFCKILNIPHQVKVMQLRDLREQKNAEYQEIAFERMFSRTSPLESRLVAEHLAYLDEALLIFTPDCFSGNLNLGFLLKEVKHLHIFMVAGRKNDITLTVDVRSESSSSSYVQELFVGEGSSVRLIIRESAVAGNMFSMKKTVAYSNSSVKTLAASKSEKTLVSRTTMVSEGTGVKNRTYALFVARGNGVLEQESTASHLVGGGESQTVTKGIGADSSTSVVRGTIHIAQEAGKTSSHYEGKVLAMGADAKANVLPTLKIFTNDVEAKHGAGVGSFSEEDMFYLQSRGLTKDEARKMLVDGFFHPILQHFQQGEQEGITNFFRM